MNNQFVFTFMYSTDGEHTEVIKQTHEVIRVCDVNGRKAFLQFTGAVTLTHQSLDDRSILWKF